MAEMNEKEFKDFNKIMQNTLNSLINYADKHNIDRDSFIKYFSRTFGTMAWSSTFTNYPRTPKERGADKLKITCLNCKHLMFSDMYGECNKQLRIVNPSDTCEYAEPKERGGANG